MPSGREASRPHVARLRVGRVELMRCGAARPWPRCHSPVAPARSGRPRSVASTMVELADVERWSRRDELDYALEAPVWDCFGRFAGQPQVRGNVTWLGRRSCVCTSN